MGNFLQIHSEPPTLQPETVFNIGNFPVTNSILMSWLLILVLIIICVMIRKKTKLKPNGYFQHIVESAYDLMYNFINKLTGKKEYTEKVFPLIATLFVYIAMSNLIGLTPVVTAFTYNHIGAFRTPSNDFNFTFSLAVGMIILIQFVSIKDWGFFGHLGKYFKIKEIFLGFRQGIMPGVMAIIDFIIGLMDIVSEFARIIALSLRLFGNMYAGDFLATLLLGAFAYALPSVWLGLNIFVAFVQAMIFGSLTTIYYVMALKTTETTVKE